MTPRVLGAIVLLCAGAVAQDDRAAALVEAAAEAAPADGTLSLLLAREAFAAMDSERTRTALYGALVRAHERAILAGHGGAVVRVDVAPDGQAIATVAGDGTVRLWTPGGKRLAEFAAGAPVRETRFLGESVLVVTDAELTIRDRAGKKVATFPRAPFEVVGPVLAITPAEGELHLVDASGKVLRDLKVASSGPAAGEFAYWAVTARGKLRWYDARGREKLVSPAAGTTRAVFEGSIAATFGSGIAVELWSSRCRKLGELLHAGPVEQVSMRGDRIFTASADGHYAFWTADGTRLSRIPKPGPCVFAEVSGDGARVVTLDDGDRVSTWPWDGEPVSKRFEGVKCVEPNRRGLGLILDFEDGTRRFVHSGLEDVRSQDFLGGELTCSGWGSRGDWLLVADDAGHAVLQHWYGAGPKYLDGHTGAIVHASFSGDDSLLVTGSRDGTGRVWAVDPPGIGTIYHPSAVTGIGFEAGRLLTCSRGALHIREPDGRAVSDIPLPSSLLWWGHGTGRVAVACKGETSAALYDLDGKEIARLGHDGLVNGVEVSPKGDLVVTFSADGAARLWDERGRVRGKLDHPGGVGSAAFSADGSLVLTTADDRQARVWSADGKLQAAFPIPEEIWYCVFSPTGRLIVGIPTESSVARVWTSDGEEVAELVGHAGPVRGASFSPEDDAIATASMDGTARLWDAKGNSGPALPHPDAVYKAVFVPGGGGVVTTCKDGAVRHWSREGRLLAVMHGHANAVWVVECTEDGATLATGSVDTTVRLWPLNRDDLLRIAKERSCREFTPEERDRYGDLLPAK